MIAAIFVVLGLLLPVTAGVLLLSLMTGMDNQGSPWTRALRSAFRCTVATCYLALWLVFLPWYFGHPYIASGFGAAFVLVLASIAKMVWDQRRWAQ